MPETSVVADVEQFILRELALGAAVESIAPDDDLLGSGIIDSHGLMELIGFLDERYGVNVADDELEPANFQSLSSIEAFVLDKRR